MLVFVTGNIGIGYTEDSGGFLKICGCGETIATWK